MMTNEERRRFLIDFIRRHRLNDAQMAKLVDRTRFWVSRARNNYSGTDDVQGDFRIPRLVIDFLKLIDMLPSSVRKNVLEGIIPDTKQDIELVTISDAQLAIQKQHLDDAGKALLERFASILHGSSASVLTRASNQLIALEITKKRSEIGKLEAAE